MILKMTTNGHLEKNKEKAWRKICDERKDGDDDDEYDDDKKRQVMRSRRGGSLSKTRKSSKKVKQKRIRTLMEFLEMHESDKAC